MIRHINLLVKIAGVCDLGGKDRIARYLGQNYNKKVVPNQSAPGAFVTDKAEEIERNRRNPAAAQRGVVRLEVTSKPATPKTTNGKNLFEEVNLQTYLSLGSYSFMDENTQKELLSRVKQEWGIEKLC